MYDLTQYSEIIRRAMAENRKNDENYSWSIKAINKSNVKFHWGYLEKTEEFILTVEAFDDETYISVKFPYDGYKAEIVILVGEDRWCDEKTIELGIYKAIIATAERAKQLY